VAVLTKIRNSFGAYLALVLAYKTRLLQVLPKILPALEKMLAFHCGQYLVRTVFGTVRIR
jgi:hypothetical protein